MSGSVAAPRLFSFEPIDTLLADYAVTNVARFLNVSATTLAGYRALGLNVVQADRLACRLGLHPVELWPHWYRAEVYA